VLRPLVSEAEAGTAGNLSRMRIWSGLGGITISREEPLALRLMRRTEGLALTRRQA
jgi:hypothetical protein